MATQPTEAGDGVYRPTSINQKRRRRTRAEVGIVKAAIVAVLEDEHPMTVRQVFYQLVSRGVIGKTEREYRSTVIRLLTAMRLAGEIPFEWIADNSRWMRKPRSYSSLSDMLERTAETYRRALWDEQAEYVEIWLEKEALAGVLYQVTAQWDVPLMVTRGYPSLSFVWEAAQAIAAQDRPCVLYYFGDYDPSGEDIPRAVEERIAQFAPDVLLDFGKVAITRKQIRDWELPTRPTKLTDTRAKGFQGESVELDAIPASQLRELVEKRIAKHVDAASLERLERVEAAERETLQGLAGVLGNSVERSVDEEE